MTTPYERLRDLISSIPEEVLDRVDRNLNDPNYVPEPVDWREDPDPLGRDWDWIEPTSSGSNVEVPPGIEHRREPPATIPFTSSASPPWKTAVLWASSLAASLIVGAVGYRALTTSSVRPALREQPMAAWVGPEVGVGANGAAIAAGPDDGRDQPPIVTNIGRPEDMKPPAAPSVYAPNRIQEQLVVPEVRPGAAGVARSIRSVQEAVRPGAIFYLELSAAGAASPGTAVVIRTEPRPWGLLEDEASVSPDDGTTYYGPLRMGDEEAEYLVVLADRRDEPLAAVVSSAGPPDAGLETWKARLVEKLRSSGHEWYGVQIIRVRPSK